MPHPMRHARCRTRARPSFSVLSLSLVAFLLETEFASLRHQCRDGSTGIRPAFSASVVDCLFCRLAHHAHSSPPPSAHLPFTFPFALCLFFFSRFLVCVRPLKHISFLITSCFLHDPSPALSQRRGGGGEPQTWQTRRTTGFSRPPLHPLLLRRKQIRTLQLSSCVFVHMATTRSSLATA